MHVGDCCDTTVVFTHRTAGITEAAKLMREFRVNTLVVVDTNDGSGRPVGLVTDRDLVVEVLAEEVPAATLTVADIMAVDPITAQWDDDLFDAIERMRAEGIRRMPVIDSSGALAGVLSVDDVLDVLADAVRHGPRVVHVPGETEAAQCP